MGRRYRIRVSGKPRENPDPAMLAHIVILIGRRLHAERLQQERQAAPTAEKAELPEDLPQAEEKPSAESDTESGSRDGV